MRKENAKISAGKFCLFFFFFHNGYISKLVQIIVYTVIQVEFLFILFYFLYKKEKKRDDFPFVGILCLYLILQFYFF